LVGSRYNGTLVELYNLSTFSHPFFYMLAVGQRSAGSGWTILCHCHTTGNIL